MRTPLTVRLEDMDGKSQMITNLVSDLSFKSISPGGFASVQATLKRPLTKEQLAAFSTLTVFDGNTGETVAAGRILDPGRSTSEGGDVSQIICLGEGLASMQDRTEPYFLVDTALDNNFYKSWRSTNRIDGSIGTYPVQSDEEATLFCEVTEGVILAINSAVEMTSRLPTRCSQRLGSFGFKDKAGISNSNFRTRAYALSLDRTIVELMVDDPWSTTISPSRVVTAGTDFSDRYDVLFQFSRITTVSPTSTEDYWATVRDFWMRAQLYNQAGTLRTDGLTVPYVLASEAFVDLVARFCPRLDLAGATVVTTAHQFDQLAWPAGISPMGALEEMMKVEAAYAWHVWEKGTNGYRTELVAKPTTVRYEATVNDDYTAPAPNSEVYNSVYVSWTSPAGREQITHVTSTVPDLDAAGVTRSSTISLETEKGSSANATKAGTDFLTEHATSPMSGTLTVSAGTQILDTFTGRRVRPWHIRPNELIRVRGVQPTTGGLNATSPDGVTVSRIVSNDYSDSNAASTLELDDFVFTESRAIAELMRKRQAR